MKFADSALRRTASQGQDYRGRWYRMGWHTLDLSCLKGDWGHQATFESCLAPNIVFLFMDARRSLKSLPSKTLLLEWSIAY